RRAARLGLPRLGPAVARRQVAAQPLARLERVGDLRDLRGHAAAQPVADLLPGLEVVLARSLVGRREACVEPLEHFGAAAGALETLLQDGVPAPRLRPQDRAASAGFEQPLPDGGRDQVAGLRPRAQTLPLLLGRPPLA